MTDASENGHSEKLSPVEIAKAASHYLAGTIAEELRDGNDFVSKASTQLLKHHGTYQQDDRERRAEARVDGPRQSQVLQLHGPHRHPRRPHHQRSTSGRARSVRRSRQHHAPHHHPPRPATPRHSQDRISSMPFGALTKCSSPRWPPAATSSATSCARPARTTATRCTSRCTRLPTNW